MFKTILVPSDGSDHAHKAVDIATDLAQKYGSRLLLLTVYKPISPMEATSTLVKSARELGVSGPGLKEQANRTVTEAEARARERGATDVRASVAKGHPARVIVDFARQHGVDAIVMGSRGLGDIGGFLLGSVSHKVSSLAGCTCITVK